MGVVCKNRCGLIPDGEGPLFESLRTGLLMQGNCRDKLIFTLDPTNACAVILICLFLTMVLC